MLSLSHTCIQIPGKTLSPTHCWALDWPATAWGMHRIKMVHGLFPPPVFRGRIKMSWLRQGENSIYIKIPLLILPHVCRYTYSFKHKLLKKHNVILKAEAWETCKPSTGHLRWAQIKCRWADIREQCRVLWQSKIRPILILNFKTPCAKLISKPCLRPWGRKGARSPDTPNALLSLSQSSLKSIDRPILIPVCSGSGPQIRVPVLSHV